MSQPSTSSTSTTSKPRRSSLTFKGPSGDKRVRAPPRVVQPEVPRRASASSSVGGKGKKRRRSGGSSTATTATKKGKSAKDVGPGRMGKVATRARTEEGKNSSRAKGKRRRVEREHDAEDDDGAEGEEAEEDADADSSQQVRRYERHVPRSVIKQSWKTLSEASREDLRWEVERGGREVLDSLSPSGSSKSRSAAKSTELTSLLSRFADELDSLLLTLPIPPLPSAVKRGSKGKGRAGEVDLGWVLERGEVRRRIAQLNQAYDLEQAEVDALSARVEEERRLLEEEESALSAFTYTREKLQAAESADLAAQSSHPLLLPLLRSRLPLREKETNRSASLVVPGLEKGKKAKREEEGGASREWFRSADASGLGGGGGRKRKRDVSEEDDEGEEEPTPAILLVRATKQAERLLRERRKGRKTSE